MSYLIAFRDAVNGVVYITRKSTRARLTRRTCRKVFVDAATDVIADVGEQSDKVCVDGGFCGEPFADNGELLSSLSPLLFSMKLFGLYFHREDRHRRRTGDSECQQATPSRTALNPRTGAASTWLRIYATVILILVWLNVFRSVFMFHSRDHFGAQLLMKIVLFTWFGLCAIMQTAYYYANHTGQLVDVLLTLPVSPDGVRGAHRVAIGLTVFAWVNSVLNAIISVYIFVSTDGIYDYYLAPLVTYIELPEDQIITARLIGSPINCLAFQCSMFAEVMTLVLVYVFYHQFGKLKYNFCLALGKGGQFTGDLSVFRRRH